MKNLFVYLSALFLFFSCEEQINLDFQDNFNSDIIISSFLGTSSDTVRIKIVQTYPIYSYSTENVEIEYVTLENITTGESFNLQEKDDTWFANSFEKNAGDICQILVKEKNSNIIYSSKDTIPKGVYISDINYFYSENSEKRPSVSVNLSFSTNLNSKLAYYELVVYKESERIDAENGYVQAVLSSQDYIITSENYYPSLVFFAAEKPKSLLFKATDNTKDLNFSYNNNLSYNGLRFKIPAHKIKVEVRRVSYAYYKYKTSLYKQQLDVNADILFGLPSIANVYSNVENGYGVFACYNSTDTIIDIEEFIVELKNP